MPSPLPSPSLPLAAPVPTAAALVHPPPPVFAYGPVYPRAGLLGMLVIALAYFALGVAVGVLVNPSPRSRRWIPVLVGPGVLAGLAFLAWVIRSLA